MIVVGDSSTHHQHLLNSATSGSNDMFKQESQSINHANTSAFMTFNLGTQSINKTSSQNQTDFVNVKNSTPNR
jgi:hypothetical protein